MKMTISATRNTNRLAWTALFAASMLFCAQSCSQETRSFDLHQNDPAVTFSTRNDIFHVYLTNGGIQEYYTIETHLPLDDKLFFTSIAFPVFISREHQGNTLWQTMVPTDTFDARYWQSKNAIVVIGRSLVLVLDADTGELCYSIKILSKAFPATPWYFDDLTGTVIAVGAPMNSKGVPVHVVSVTSKHYSEQYLPQSGRGITDIFRIDSNIYFANNNGVWILPELGTGNHELQSIVTGHSGCRILSVLNNRDIIYISNSNPTVLLRGDGEDVLDLGQPIRYAQNIGSSYLIIWTNSRIVLVDGHAWAAYPIPTLQAHDVTRVRPDGQVAIVSTRDGAHYLLNKLDVSLLKISLK